MTKQKKRVVVLTLALALVLSLACAVFAVDVNFNIPFSYGYGLGYNTMSSSTKSASAAVNATATSSSSLLSSCGFTPYVVYNGSQISNPGQFIYSVPASRTMSYYSNSGVATGSTVNIQAARTAGTYNSNLVVSGTWHG